MTSPRCAAGLGTAGASMIADTPVSRLSGQETSYLVEFEHLTLARVLLARDRAEFPGGSIHEVTSLLERLLRAAEEGARTGSVLEVLVLQALAQQTQGDIPAALASLRRALCRWLSRRAGCPNLHR